MAEISRSALFGKLNSVAYRAIEGGTVLCKKRGNPVVQLEHWLNQLLQNEASDIPRILDHFSIQRLDVQEELTHALDRLPRGASSISDLDSSVDLAVERGWLYSTLIHGVASVRSGVLLAAILKTPSLQARLQAISPVLASIGGDRLMESLRAATRGSSEDELGPFADVSLQAADQRLTRDIFISYRRSEAQHLAGRVFDHVEQSFGPSRVFKDVDAITVGTRDFAQNIETQLRSAKLLIALIGPSWLTIRDAAGRRRIDDRNDLVRLEIKWGLDRQIPVLPLLFDDAAVPTASQLPAAIRALAKCQAIPLRVDPDFRVDMGRVIRACQQYLA